MTDHNQIEKKLLKERAIMAEDDPLNLLAEFFKGVVIKFDEEYTY